MIYISMDIDWAPDWAIEEAAQIVLSRGLALTLFITHDSAAVRRLATHPRVECALHPNYMPGSSHGATHGDVLDHISGLCPGAVGVRAHGLVRSTSLVVDYGERGFEYEASDLLFLHPGLRGTVYWNGVAQLPTWWEDDVHMLYGRPMLLADIPLQQAPPLAVFDFHPILVALNSGSLEGYGRLKRRLAKAGKGLHEVIPNEVAAESDSAGAGTSGGGDRALLTALCDWCAAHPDEGRRTLRHAATELRRTAKALRHSRGDAQ